MADIWYYANGQEQVGPFTLKELKTALREIPDAHEKYVWRDGFANWEKAKHVAGLLQHSKTTETIVPPPLSQRSDVNRYANVKRVKWRWAFNGALVGAAIALSDYLLEWRGPQFYLWTGDGLAHNLGFIGGMVGFAALIGFIAGVFQDRSNRNLAR